MSAAVVKGVVLAFTAIFFAKLPPALSADPPPPEAVSCFTKFLNAPNPDDYLPAAARAARRSGTVTIEARVMPGASRPVDVTVIESSSHPDLDEAAVRLARDTRYKTNCSNGGSVKFRVKFSA